MAAEAHLQTSMMRSSPSLRNSRHSCLPMSSAATPQNVASITQAARVVPEVKAQMNKRAPNAREANERRRVLRSVAWPIEMSITSL